MIRADRHPIILIDVCYPKDTVLGEHGLLVEIFQIYSQMVLVLGGETVNLVVPEPELAS